MNSENEHQAGADPPASADATAPAKDNASQNTAPKRVRTRRGAPNQPPPAAAPPPQPAPQERRIAIAADNCALLDDHARRCRALGLITDAAGSVNRLLRECGPEAFRRWRKRWGETDGDEANQPR